MKGMRTKGSDLNTDFGEVKAMEDVQLPLSRVQDGIFERSSSKEKESDLGDVPPIKEMKTDIPAIGDRRRSSKEKKAVIFDGYSYRVTIESKAGNNNQNYSFITNMLSAADIRYREVRRYTVEPDRVMLDILVRKEDVDVIEELDKEGKKYDVTFSFNDNISEGIKPKEIVTPEKEVPEKVEASKKTAMEFGTDEYIIVGEEVDDETGEPLYWNNDDGWVDKSSATVFTEEEVDRLYLPIGGKWVKASKKTGAKMYKNRETGKVDTLENWRAAFDARKNDWEWFGIDTEEKYLSITDNGENPLVWDNDLVEVDETNASKKTAAKPNIAARQRSITAANWKYQLDLSDIRKRLDDDVITPAQAAKEIVKQLHELEEKFSKADEENFGSGLGDVISEFETIMDDPDTSVDDFDYALERLYDLGDERTEAAEGVMENRLIWVNFASILSTADVEPK